MSDNFQGLAWDDKPDWMNDLKENLSNRELTGDTLFNLQVITNEAEFRSKYNQRTWDFIILDIFQHNSPTEGEYELTGLNLCRWIIHNNPPPAYMPPIFLVTKEINITRLLKEFNTLPDNVKWYSKNSGLDWITAEIIESLKKPGAIKDPNKVFIIHGREMLDSVARVVEKLELKSVILAEQPGGIQTVIEKFEKNSDIGYAIALFTPDDEGKLKTDVELVPRARQNVLIELGYFISKISRERITILRSKGVDIPSDLLGCVYLSLDDHGAWKLELAKNMKAAGLKIDLNKL